MVVSESSILKPVSRQKRAQRKHFVTFLRYNTAMKQRLWCTMLLSFALIGGILFQAPKAQAASVGMHVLHPEEFVQVEESFREVRGNDPLYITIPFSLADLERLPEWQKSFDFAREKNIVPLVRLVTKFEPEKNAWAIPSQKDIVDLARGLNSLQWPQDKRHVIFFNEPNHAAEWGGTINPHEFAEKTDFALNWFQTESAEYVMLPAALDLAASDTSKTKEAFAYWREALGSKPEILEKITAWNSHSYPNPAFSSSPQERGKNRLDGFRHELTFLKNYTSRELPVFITETGWSRAGVVDRKLASYYQQAMTTVWSDPKIVAVTPFVFAGSPGPFAGFSFIDEKGKPTAHWVAFEKALAAQRLLSDRSVLQ